MRSRVILMLFFLVLSVGWISGQTTVPGQKSVLMIDGNFVYTQGAWADYNIFDKTENKTYRMKIAILEQENVKSKPYRWMEIEVAMEGEPVVVTRVLIEEIPNGPGKMEKAIVQVEGYDPFSIPKKFFQDDNPEVGQFEPAQIVRRLENKIITIAGKSLSVWEVEAQSAQGEVVTASVSDELPPMALVAAETADMTMTVRDWGRDARTMIKGKPKSFMIWILDQIGKEIKK